MEHARIVIEKASECRDIIESSIHRNSGDSLLLSGGLDTSIIAHVAAERETEVLHRLLPARQGARCSSRQVNRHKTRPRPGSLELAPELLRERLVDVISVLKTFDPMEVRNSVAVYHGLTPAPSQER